MDDDLIQKNEWIAEYEASSALKAEFETVSDFVAFKAADAKGYIRVLHH